MLQCLQSIALPVLEGTYAEVKLQWKNRLIQTVLGARSIGETAGITFPEGLLVWGCKWNRMLWNLLQELHWMDDHLIQKHKGPLDWPTRESLSFKVYCLVYWVIGYTKLLWGWFQNLITVCRLKFPAMWKCSFLKQIHIFSNAKHSADDNSDNQSKHLHSGNQGIFGKERHRWN